MYSATSHSDARCFSCRFVRPRNSGTYPRTVSSLIVATCDPSWAAPRSLPGRACQWGRLGFAAGGADGGSPDGRRRTAPPRGRAYRADPGAAGRAVRRPVGHRFGAVRRLASSTPTGARCCSTCSGRATGSGCPTGCPRPGPPRRCGPARLRPTVGMDGLAATAARLASIATELAWFDIADRIERRLLDLATRLGRPGARRHPHPGAADPGRARLDGGRHARVGEPCRARRSWLAGRSTCAGAGATSCGPSCGWWPTIPSSCSRSPWSSAREHGPQYRPRPCTGRPHRSHAAGATGVQRLRRAAPRLVHPSLALQLAQVRGHRSRGQRVHLGRVVGVDRRDELGHRAVTRLEPGEHLFLALGAVRDVLAELGSGVRSRPARGPGRSCAAQAPACDAARPGTAVRSPSGGSMKLVPRPSTASPVNSAPLARSRNTT